jgi:hypothetical protein
MGVTRLNTVRTCGQVHELGGQGTRAKFGVEAANRGMAWVLPLAKAVQIPAPFTVASRTG